MIKSVCVYCGSSFGSDPAYLAAARALAAGLAAHDLTVVYGGAQVGLMGAVADLAVDQCPRHHADHLAAGRQRTVSDHTHQPDLAAAVDDADTALGQLDPEIARRVCVHRIVPWVGSGVDADAAHPE